MGRDRREDDRCRNRSAVSSGFLSFFSLTMHDKYFSFIILKMLFLIFWPLPKKLLDCPPKNILPDCGGLQPPPQPPSSYAYGYSHFRIQYACEIHVQDTLMSRVLRCDTLSFRFATKSFQFKHTHTLNTLGCVLCFLYE